MFEEELISADELLPHLDQRVSWDVHKAERVAVLYSIAERCLELRYTRRPEIVYIIPELEEVCRGTEALASERPVNDRRECVKRARIWRVG